MRGRTKAALAAPLAGLLVASLMMARAWQRNPHGRFHGPAVDGGVLVHWGAWSLLGASWFVPVAGGVLVGIGLCFALRSWRRRARKQVAG
jgi:hypothetical protein